MKTPICDFVSRYADSNTLRLHMPGHKGVGALGVEARDITEIRGADSLFEADGIIRESEENASALFACPTLYSTEGSSQCIRAMLYLAILHAKAQSRAPLIWAARNAHKTFLSAVALLDAEVEWLHGKDAESYLSCTVDANELDARLQAADRLPVAVYLTSPDYLGNVADVRSIADACHRHGVLLIVDNAHGAYLKFLTPSRHPIDLGADLACDSAHKTLPVITGGAYLHVASSAPASLLEMAKDALSLFSSTSPSYLILQSLDAANPYLEKDFATRLQAFIPHVRALREHLCDAGWESCGTEELKLTLKTKPYGYTGTEVADALRKSGIECELADPDFTVFMLTPEIGEAGLLRLKHALDAIPRRTPLNAPPPVRTQCVSQMSVRAAMLSPMKRIPIDTACGRILAAPSVSCPPAVPIAVSGEVLNENAIAAFRYYGIEFCTVTDQ